MNKKRFFTKINKNGRNVIIDKECHTELFDMTLACEVLNRLDLKLKHYNEVNGEQQSTIEQLQDLCGESDGENAKLRIENKRLQEENEHFRKSRDKWKTKALQKDEQLKDCDNDCFNCRFYNKVCDFCTKFHIYTMTSGDVDE